MSLQPYEASVRGDSGDRSAGSLGHVRRRRIRERREGFNHLHTYRPIQVSCTGKRGHSRTLQPGRLDPLVTLRPSRRYGDRRARRPEEKP
jgi:hypothetical protein